MVEIVFHFVIGPWYVNASVFPVRNVEKLVVLLVYSLFRRVATSGFRRISVATDSGGGVR